MLPEIFNTHYFVIGQMCSDLDIIQLHFSATECNGWPKVRVLIDNVLISTTEINQIRLSLPVELPPLTPGEHVLSVEMFDKTTTNTLISNDQIVKDQLLELVDIQFDNIVLPEYHKYNGTFYYNNHSIPSMTKWGFNGRFCWKFNTPLISWLASTAETYRRYYGLSSTLYVDTQKSILLNKLNNFISLLDEQEV